MLVVCASVVAVIASVSEGVAAFVSEGVIASVGEVIAAFVGEGVAAFASEGIIAFVGEVIAAFVSEGVTASVGEVIAARGVVVSGEDDNGSVDGGGGVVCVVSVIGSLKVIQRRCHVCIKCYFHFITNAHKRTVLLANGCAT